MANDLIPTTILTGFLGSGKTTLLNKILKDDHGLKIAVIENEFGEEGIDNDLLLQGDEQIVEMNNGCICCTVRGDLVRILLDLKARRDAGEIHFDRVVIETTGLADPGPVAQTFFMDDEVAQSYMLDAIITVVDALHGNQQLDETKEAQALGLVRTEEVQAVYKMPADNQPGDAVVELKFGNKEYTLHEGPAASGSRYVTSDALSPRHQGVSWHSKRNEAIIAGLVNEAGVNEVVDGPLLYRCVQVN